MKKLIFIAFLASLVISIFWSFGKFFNHDMSILEKQTYSIMSGVKYLISIALYIAWRVTPESKQ